MTQVKTEKERAHTGKTERLVFDGFRLFPTGEKGKLVATYSRNCSCADGVLQGGIGFEPYLDRNGDEVLTIFGKDRRAVYVLEGWENGEGSALVPYYFLHSKSGKIWQYSVEQGGYVEKENLGLNAYLVAASAPNGQTKIIISGENGAYCVDGEKWTKINDVAAGNGTAAVCFSKHRTFVGEKPCKLLYSNPEAPWDFTNSYDDGGYVYLPLNKGDIVDMVEYGDNVYVFFQRGIVRVKPDGLARNFQVREVPYFGGEIFAKSVGICENWMFFLSENGICRFDGDKVERVGRCLDVLPAKRGQVCAHATVGDYFVLQYFDAGMYMTRTVALRADDKDAYFIYDYEGLNESNRMPVCVVENKVSTLREGGDLPSGEAFVFKSGFIGLDGVGRKYLKSVTVYGEGRIDLSVATREDELEFNVEDLPQKQKIDVGLRGEEFRFSFHIEKSAKLRKMELEYECIV